MTNHEMGEYALSAPPVTVVGLTLMGITLQDWVFILTIVYLLMQMGYFVWKRFDHHMKAKYGRKEQ